MRKIVIRSEGLVLKEVELAKDSVTLGRRPYNDVVMNDLLVSGEHALIRVDGTSTFLEDRKSTNGTFLNGRQLNGAKQLLRSGDEIRIGKYGIQYLDDLAETSRPVDPPNAGERSRGAVAATGGRIRVLTGTASGRDMPLIKVVTTIGKPGVAIAAITRFPHGFVVSQVDGQNPRVNGVEVAAEPVLLQHADVIELADTRMEFLLHAAA